MPFLPMNVILNQNVNPGSMLSLAYPEGKSEGNFFGAANHTLSVNGAFFRSPRDFTVIAQPERLVFTWHGEQALRAGTLLNLQLEMPGGDYYYDPKLGVTVSHMVSSALFMVNLASPAAPQPEFWLSAQRIADHKPITPHPQTLPIARNIVIHTEQDEYDCIFTIEGEDMYKRPMVEKIAVTSVGTNAGKKAFSTIMRLSASHACKGPISVGTGDKLGLPVFLPSPGYLLREIINGVAVTGGTIAGGETAIPSATTGDRRGTYTPPPSVVLDGRHSIHLLLSLLAPGNIGIPDFAG